MSQELCQPRIWRLVLCVFVLLIGLQPVLSTQSYAKTTQATALQQLAQTLTAPNRVRADFTQTRHLKAFTQPLVTQGQLLLLPQQALIWQQQSPIPQVLVLTATQGWMIDQGEATALSAQAQASMAPLLLATLSGDWPSLQTQFLLDYQPAHSTQAQWQLQLHPKPDTPLHAVFDHITLEGQQTIEHITLQGREGDLTELRLTPQPATPLTAQERDWLTPPVSEATTPSAQTPLKQP